MATHRRFPVQPLQFLLLLPVQRGGLRGLRERFLRFLIIGLLRLRRLGRRLILRAPAAQRLAAPVFPPQPQAFADDLAQFLILALGELLNLPFQFRLFAAQRHNLRFQCQQVQAQFRHHRVLIDRQRQAARQQFLDQRARRRPIRIAQTIQHGGHRR